MIKFIKSINVMFILSTFLIVCVLLQNLYNLLKTFIYDMSLEVIPNITDYINEFLMVMILIMFFLSILIKNIYEMRVDHERTN